MSADSPPTPTYKRVLLKLSGETLMGDQQFGADPAVATRIARDAGDIHALGVENEIASSAIVRRWAWKRRSSSPAATSSATWQRARAAWIARPPTIWACSPPSS